MIELDKSEIENLLDGLYIKKKQIISIIKSDLKVDDTSYSLLTLRTFSKLIETIQALELKLVEYRDSIKTNNASG